LIIGSPIRDFDWRQNERPGMISKGHYALYVYTRAPWCCYLFILVSHSVFFSRCYNGLDLSY